MQRLDAHCFMRRPRIVVLWTTPPKLEIWRLPNRCNSLTSVQNFAECVSGSAQKLTFCLHLGISATLQLALVASFDLLLFHGAQFKRRQQESALLLPKILLDASASSFDHEQ